MKSKPFPTLSAMLLAVLAWVALPVQEAQGEAPPAFAVLDEDKNGFITAEEAVEVPGLAARLTQLDVNADSKLSREEYAALAVEELQQPSAAPKQPSAPQ